MTRTSALVYIAEPRTYEMRADRVEVSWDNEKSKWLVRIQVGEEFIRRYCSSPRDVDEQKLRADAQKTLADEGYELNGGQLVVKR